MGPAQPGTKFCFLQALRAIAAWLVIADHALIAVTRGELSNPVTPLAWALGGSGVYIFFVISGFIMVHISWDDFGHPGAAQQFMRRRIIRIVPLYWLATMGAIVFHRASANDTVPAGLPELLRSLFFIPYYAENIGWAPILRQGWTLNYEMMFYVLFAVALTFPRKVALWGVAAALGIFTLVGPVLPPGILAYLSSPITLWFVLGMGIAWLWRLCGLSEPESLARSVKFLEPFGDASYSTYLVHGVTLTMLLQVWRVPSAWFVPLAMVVAAGAGLAVHIMIEKPMLHAITGKKLSLIINRGAHNVGL
jgi:exopolysaccharide production protein ExoZ